MGNRGKILVTGATGNAGSALLKHLNLHSVRVLIHDGSNAQLLRDRGVEVVVGDLSRPETLVSTFEEVDRVFHVTPTVQEQATLGINLTNAAKESGNNPYVVRLSDIKASHEAPTRLTRQHAEIEDALTSSGLPYTLLRPHCFMQNTIAVALTIASEGKDYQQFGEGKLGMADARDIGEAAAKVLTEDGHEGATYTLTAPPRSRTATSPRR